MVRYICPDSGGYKNGDKEVVRFADRPNSNQDVSTPDSLSPPSLTLIMRIIMMMLIKIRVLRLELSTIILWD